MSLSFACFNVGCKKPGEKTKICSQCQLAYYCDDQCQRKHWKQHKVECKKGQTEKNIMENTLATQVNSSGCEKMDNKTADNDKYKRKNHKIKVTQNMSENTPETEGVSLRCANVGCNKAADDKCLGCKLVRYCNETCQNNDWKQYRRTCNNIKNNDERRLFPRGSIDTLNPNNDHDEKKKTDETVAKINQFIKTNIPKFAMEYSQLYPNDKFDSSILSEIHKTAVYFFFFERNMFSQMMGGYDTLEQILCKRWGFHQIISGTIVTGIPDYFLEYLTSKPKLVVGEICDCYHTIDGPACYTSISYNYNFKNIPIFERKFHSGVHLYVGFVDLTQLLFVDIATNSNVEFRGYDGSDLAIARANIILKLVENIECPDKIILQIWFSALLTAQAEKIVRRVCKDLAVVETSERLARVFQH